MTWWNMARTGSLFIIIGILSAAQAAEPIKIGFEAALTGGSSSAGIPMRNAVELAVAEINAKGGIAGRPILLVERDDEGKNELGVQIAQELIDKEHVVAALGYTNTGVALANQRFYEEANIPVMTLGPTGTVITKQFTPPQYDRNFVFRMSINDAIQSEMIAREAVDRSKYTKVAILADSTNYGQLGRADLEAALSKRGVTPVAVEKFNIGDVDMSAQILRAKESGAQVILTYGIGPELARIANGMARLGWKVPMIGSWTLAYANFIDNAGENGEGTRMPLSFVEEPSTAKRKAFIDAYAKGYGRNTMPAMSAQAYDGLYILAAALRQAGSTDGTKLLDALENLKEPVEGVVTTYVKPFAAGDHEALSANVGVIGEIRNGRVAFAYDEDRKNASIVRVKSKD